MFSAMQASAYVTTSVAEVMVRPSASSTGGSTRSPRAAINSEIGRRFNISSGSLEPRDAFAEQTPWPEQQYQQHQQIDRSGGGRGIADSDHYTFDETDQQCCGNHAPKRSEAPNHHDHEGRRDDLLAHRGMDGIDRRQQHAGEACEPDAECCNRRHIGLQRNAERTDHVWILDTGADHAAEGSLLQKQPQAGDASRCNAKQYHAIKRIDE